ncbi:MAG: type II secretion system protein [Bacillota bacterium]
MVYLKKLSTYCLNNRGLTLVELLAVIVIIGILGSVAAISVLGLIKGTEEDICEANSSQLEKEYHREMVLNEVEHSESRFNSHVLKFGEVCPVGGNVVYVDGHVECSVHAADEETGEEDGDRVPFL